MSAASADQPIRHLVSPVPTVASSNSGPPCFSLFVRYLECRMSKEAAACERLQTEWKKCIERKFTS
jgi:hypothetical protein